MAEMVWSGLTGGLVPVTGFSFNDIKEPEPELPKPDITNLLPVFSSTAASNLFGFKQEPEPEQPSHKVQNVGKVGIFGDVDFSDLGSMKITIPGAEQLAGTNLVIGASGEIFEASSGERFERITNPETGESTISGTGEQSSDAADKTQYQVHVITPSGVNEFYEGTIAANALMLQNLGFQIADIKAGIAQQESGAAVTSTFTGSEQVSSFFDNLPSLLLLGFFALYALKSL